MSAPAQMPVVVQPPGGGPGGALGILRRAGLVFLRQREATIFVVAVVLLLYFGIRYYSTFVTELNVTTLLSGTAAPIIIIGIGEVFLLICGEIDLSAGFIYQFCPFVMLYLNVYDHVPALLAVFCGLLAGLIAGWVNGFLVVTLRLPSFIATLGTGFILNGMALTFSHAEPVEMPGSLKGVGSWVGIDPWAQFIWAAALTAIFYVVLTRTRWGLHTIAAGGILLGAREAGIPVGRIKYGNFMLTGVLAALVGMQVAFYDASIDPTAGGYGPMFYSVTAAVLGGTALLGGAGSILGAFLGAMVVATLFDGLDVVGVSANPENIILGVLILVAMVANVWLAVARERGRTP